MGLAEVLERASALVQRADTALAAATTPRPRRAAQAVENAVRQAVLDNLRSAGIKSVLGRLAAAIGAMSVGYGKGKLYWSLPGGLDEEVYRYANALESGWLRGPAKLRKTARRKLMRAGSVGGAYKRVPARPYIYLSAGQEAEIIARFQAALTE